MFYLTRMPAGQQGPYRGRTSFRAGSSGHPDRPCRPSRKSSAPWASCRKAASSWSRTSPMLAHRGPRPGQPRLCDPDDPVAGRHRGHRRGPAGRFPAISKPRKEDICYATTNRQHAVKAIAPRADMVLVVGAPNSSNSMRLVEVARPGCGARHAGPARLRHRLGALGGRCALGVTAGASAPDILIQEVLQGARDRFDVTIEEVTLTREDVVFKLPRVLTAARPPNSGLSATGRRRTRAEAAGYRNDRYPRRRFASCCRVLLRHAPVLRSSPQPPLPAPSPGRALGRSGTTLSFSSGGFGNRKSDTSISSLLS